MSKIFRKKKLRRPNNLGTQNPIWPKYLGAQNMKGQNV